MKKLLNNRWFVAALATAAIIFVAMSLTKKPASTSTAAIAISEEQAIPDATAAQPDEERISVQEALKQLGRVTPARDPFAVRPTAEQVAAAEQQPEHPDVLETVKLSAVWTQNATTYVVVNGRVHEVGDAVGSILIESAGPDGVWLSHSQGRSFLAAGEIFTLKTPGRSTAKPSSP